MAILSGMHVEDLLPSIDSRRPEARWPVVVAVAAMAGLYSFALPARLTLGPAWLMPAVVAALLIPTILAHRLGHHEANRFLGTLLIAVLTIFICMAVVKLVYHLPKHDESAVEIMKSAVTLWVSNILVFACWYWRLDAGGPHARDERVEHVSDSFLFPQMSMTEQDRKMAGQSGWSPGFVDYLFVAFNTSASFAPADTAVLSRWAKALMMVQSCLSITIVAILAARAINIL